MSSSFDFLDEPVSDQGLSGSDIDGFLNSSAERDASTPFIEPGYEGSTDYRIRQLSYSSILTLHSCPRKFQLYKLRTSNRTEQSLKTTVTFAYGHVVGEAIQLAFQSVPEEEIIWRMFLMWDADLYAADEKLNKSLWGAIIAIKRFNAMRKAGFLHDYELVTYNSKPATELSFCINFPDGYRYRGHVDAVLRNKSDGKIIVLECKTTGADTTNTAQFKNSAQAIGYSIVLDAIFPGLSSYDVLYLIYNTKQGEYTPVSFSKSYLQRALWIRELLLDIEQIKAYEEAQIYPMHGESCFAFFRECEYINSCTLSTAHLTKPCTSEDEDKMEYEINLTLADLLESQLSKS